VLLVDAQNEPSCGLAVEICFVAQRREILPKLLKVEVVTGSLELQPFKFVKEP